MGNLVKLLFSVGTSQASVLLSKLNCEIPQASQVKAMTRFNGDLPCDGLSEKGGDKVGGGHVLGVGRTLAFSYHLCPLHFYTSPTLLTHSVEFNLLLFLVLSVFFFFHSQLSKAHTKFTLP